MQYIHSRVIILFLSLLSLASAEEFASFPVKIDSVLILGNEKTRDEVILREIAYQWPDSLFLEDIQQIQNRITNLFLFNRVAMNIAKMGGKNYLIIEVTESWYIYPVPVLFISERDWSKVSYGFQLSHINFRGMNERLSIGGWLGYNPAFFFRYSNPWVGRHARLIMGIAFSYRSVGNKFIDFDERHLGGSFGLGKRLNLHTSLNLSFSLEHIEFPEEFPEEYRRFMASGNNADVVPKLNFTFHNDHRDLIEYPRKGYYMRYTVTRAGFTDQQPDFWRFDFDNRAYLKLTGRLSIAGRNRLTLNKGELPIYDRIFIGFSERIRGYFNRQFTDENRMMHNYEMRFSILPIKYISWSDAPIMPMFFQQLKYGLSMGLFLDSGIVWDKKEEFSLKNHFTGFGIGLHFHVPYIHLLRLDHAWNDRGDREWTFEAEVVF